MRRPAVLLAFLAASGPAWATSGARALAVPMSVRQMGMGDVSAAGNDVLRAWSNPALLSGQRTQGEVALGGASLFGAAASTLGLGGGWVLSPSLAVGGLFQTYGTSFDRLSDTGDSLGTALEQRTTAVGATASWKQGPVAAGLTLKSVSDSVLGSGVTTGAADLGVAAAWNGFGAGAALRNVGGTLRAPALAGAAKDGLPAELRIGGAYRYAPWRLGLGAEYVSVADAQGEAGAGAEWWVVDWFAVRAGAAGLGSAAQRPTFGLSAVFNGLSVDYAMAAHPLGPTHRMSLSYAFGGAAEEAAAEAGAAAGTPGVKRKRVVVARLYASQVSGEDADGMADLLRNELVGSPKVETLTWDATQEVVGKNLLARGCAVEDCGVKIGKQSKADYVVVGSVGKLMGRYFVSARVVDVATGLVKVIDQAKGDTVDALEQGIKALAARLAKKLR